MSTDKKHRLKEILKSPDLSALRTLLPHLSENNITELALLLERYRALDTDIKQQQDNSRSLSRQIGEVKKQGHDIATLLADMRAMSAELKSLDEKRQAQEDKLLSYIPNGDEVNTDTSSQELLRGRHYRDNHFDDKIHISELQEDTSTWNRYVEQQAAASIYHLAQWRDLICILFGHESRYFYAHDSAGTVKGILPLIHLKSRLFGDFMVSMPYFNYGGAIGDSPAIEDALIQHANQQADGLGLEHIEYRDDIPRSGFPERTDKVNMILPLPRDEDALWQSFSPKLRSQIRRPKREDTQVKLGRLELLNDFYHVFARNMRDLGTPVYSKALFAAILRTFPYNAHILIVYLADKPVAGAFLIGYKESLEIPWASTIRSVNHLSINMLMYWEVLRFAIREKYSYFDFGRSSTDSGTFKFKKQWGAQPKQLYWHYWLNNREIPALNPSNPKYKLMINVWRNLPIWITKLVGPIVVKNLP